MGAGAQVGALGAAAFLLAAGSAYGRGEAWMPKPVIPPPIATLTNEAQYIEWKWRTNVADPTTGLDAGCLSEKVEALRKKLQPKEDWRVVKAKCFALVCDEMAVSVSPLDWYPAFSVWNRYARPLDYFKHGKERSVAKKFYPETRRRMDEGNASGKWSIGVDFDHSVPVWEELIADGLRMSASVEGLEAESRGLAPCVRHQAWIAHSVLL